MNSIIAVAAAFGLVVVGLFIGQVAYASFHLRHRSPRLLRGDATVFEWHIIVPALNEESVIGETVRALSSIQPRCRLWVVDDGSDDDTAQIARALAEADDYVHLVERRAPYARSGKSDALNAAYYRILEWRAKTADVNTPTRTIIGVVDADGRLMDQTLDVLAGASGFADPQVGAVQQDVWMRNGFDRRPLPQKSRAANWMASLLLTLQDVEFRSAIAGIQSGRHGTQSVAMGGNGQWTRLAALDEIAAADAQERMVTKGVPWHGALLEDFELGVHVMLAGWKSVFLPRLWVSQEALPSLSLYIRQRTRWTQGTMQCARYLPKLWNGAYVGPWALLETGYYLLQPWLWIVGTFLFPLPLIDVAQSFWNSPAAWLVWVSSAEGVMWVTMFWVIALGPLTSWGLTYRSVLADPFDVDWQPDGDGGEVLVYGTSSQTSITRLQGLGYGLAYVALVQVSYVIAWKALVRILRAKSGWAKTARMAEISLGQHEAIETGGPVHVGRSQQPLHGSGLSS